MVDDLRYALRSLLNSRGFTAVALLVIALSVGAIAPIYSIVDAALLRPLPYPDAANLVIVRDSDIPVSQVGRLPMSQRNYVDWSVHRQGLDGIAGIRGAGRVEATIDGTVHTFSVSRVSGNFFSILREVPVPGRAIVDDDLVGGRRVAVITPGLWRRVFGGREDILGQTLTFENATYEVVGVTREGFLYPAGSSAPSDVFTPLVIAPAQRASTQRGAPFLTAIGRLGDGVSLEQAQAAMDRVAASLRAEYPGWEAGVTLQPYHEFVTGRSATWMRLLLWGVILVFLTMCANVANLLLARAGARRREIGVRAALGASRMRIARQLLLESLLLALAGTAAGLLIGWWVLDLLRQSLPPGVPRAIEIALDWRVLAIAAMAALVTGAIFGLAPALFGTRVDLTSALKSGGAGAMAGGAARLRSLLIVGEVAVGLVLLVGALLFGASFLKVTSVPLGVAYENVVTFPFQYDSRSLPGDDFWAPYDRAHMLADRLVAQLRAVPGVEAVAATSATPFGGGRSQFSYRLPGRPDFKWSRESHGMVSMKMVSADYLQLLRIPLIRGRYLNDQDTREAEGAVVVSESAARMIWPGEDPIGQEINLQKHLRVVGIVADVRMGGPETDPWPDVYVPLLQGRGTTAGTLIVRTSLPAEQLLPSLRAAIARVDSSQQIRNVTTLESQLSALLAQRRFNMIVVGTFGGLAVLIAAIGLYGVIAYLVTQRTREIGVRMALGASRGSVFRLVLRRAGALTALGLAVGAGGVWYFSAAVRAFLFQLDPLEPRVLAAAIVVMALTALAAALIPARRAASVDPLIALRQD